MEKKRKKIGRSTKYNPAEIDKVESLSGLGLTQEEIAIYLDVNPSQVTRWKEKYPEFRNALIKGRVIAEVSLTRAMFESAKKGNVLAASFLLCNWFPNKFRHTQRIEHIAKDVLPPTIVEAKE